MRTSTRLPAVIAVGIAAVLALTGIAGCGSTDEKPASDRPSAAEISASLQEVGDDPASQYTAEEADCIAEILVASGLSDSALRGIAAGVPGFEKSAEDDALYQGLVPNISACLVGSLPKPTQSPTSSPTPAA